MYIISALGLCGLFSSRTPMEHHAHPLGCAHPTLETTDVDNHRPSLEYTVEPVSAHLM
jgi:hypothetical protein